MKKKKAFTLSEALITLTVLGIIAALTVPLIKGNIEEKITVERLKTVYESLSIAFEMAVIDNGPVEKWGMTKKSEQEGYIHLDDIFWSKISPYLKTVNFYSIANFPNDKGWKTLSLKDKSEVGRFDPQLQLTNGVCYSTYWIQSHNCKSDEDIFGKEYCGNFAVDTNCSKGPNIRGRDIFLFYVTNNKLVPAGDANDALGFNFNEYCKTFKDTIHAGFGCTAWVIYNENMDYLRCPNKLSWAGNHSCP